MSVTERQLKEIAQRLGGAAEAGLDVERTAEAVVERLRGQPSVQVGWRRHAPVVGALAAAATAILAVGILSSNSTFQNRTVIDLAPTSAGLHALSFEELEEVYDSLSFEAPVSELTTASLDDLSIGQLEELLETLMED